MREPLLRLNEFLSLRVYGAVVGWNLAEKLTQGGKFGINLGQGCPTLLDKAIPCAGWIRAGLDAVIMASGLDTIAEGADVTVKWRESLRGR